MNTDRSSDGPYTDGGGRGAHVIGPGLEDKQQRTFIDVDLASLLNLAYAEGRKATEKYTEKMLVFAKDEVRKCHEEIRRLEEKYARNVYKMPPYNPSFDEKEHSELVDKGTKDLAGHVDEKGPTDGASYWTPITNVELEILIKDFDEILELANELNKYHKECYEGCNDMPASSRKFESWKRARRLV